MGKETKKFLERGVGGSYAGWEGCPGTGNPKCQSPVIWTEDCSWCCLWHLEMDPFVSPLFPLGLPARITLGGQPSLGRVWAAASCPVPRFPASTCPASQIMVA